MKSLRRWTLEVRTSRSNGGLSAVNMCELRVEGVIDSGEGYCGDERGVLGERALDDGLGLVGYSSSEDIGFGDALWCRVVLEERDDVDGESLVDSLVEDKEVVDDEGESRGFGGSKILELSLRPPLF